MERTKTKRTKTKSKGRAGNRLFFLLLPICKVWLRIRSLANIKITKNTCILLLTFAAITVIIEDEEEEKHNVYENKLEGSGRTLQ